MSVMQLARQASASLAKSVAHIMCGISCAQGQHMAQLSSFKLSYSALLRFADPACMQVEDFYFSSAAGRARIVLGNRRWGENGYVASGRQQARPAQHTPNNKVLNNCLASLACSVPLQASCQPSCQPHLV